jgi:hypothetical protein
MQCGAAPTARPLTRQTACEISCASRLHSRAGLRSTVSALALAAAALSWPIDSARAACTPTLAPTTDQTVTCDSSQPNPVTTGITAQPGSTNVTVNMLSGAQLNVGGGDAIVLGGGGQVSNSSGAIIQGVRGVNITGSATIANDGQIGGNGGPGVIFGGAGNSILNNTGQINGSGAAAVQFNTVAGFSQTFNNTGNGSINGNFVGSGDGQIVIVNGGNFNGGITISGNGTNSITTQSGRNINGQSRSRVIRRIRSSTPPPSTTGSSSVAPAPTTSPTRPARSSTRPSPSRASRTSSTTPVRSTMGW